TRRRTIRAVLCGEPPARRETPLRPVRRRLAPPVATELLPPTASRSRQVSLSRDGRNLLELRQIAASCFTWIQIAVNRQRLEDITRGRRLEFGVAAARSESRWRFRGRGEAFAVAVNPMALR